MKKVLISVFLCTSLIGFASQASATDKWTNLDSANDLNGCKVRLSYRSTASNQIAPGQTVWEVHDPKFDDESGDHDSLRVESCDSINRLLITQIDKGFEIEPTKNVREPHDLENGSKGTLLIRTLNAFLCQAIDPNRGYKHVYAWIPKVREGNLSEEYIVLTKRFGFQEDGTWLPHPVTARVLDVPQGLTQISASAIVIADRLVSKRQSNDFKKALYDSYIKNPNE